MRLGPLAIVLLLLSASAAAANPPYLGLVSFEAGQATGKATWDGTLRAIFLEGPDAMAPEFFLSAAALHLESDYADPNSDPAGLVVLGQNPTTDVQEFSDAIVVGRQARDGMHGLIAAKPGEARMTLVSDCLTSAQPTDTFQTYIPYGSRSAMRYELGGMVRLGICGQGSDLVISGSFVLVLWEWDALLTSGGSSQDLVSGKRPSSTTGLNDETVYRFDEHYLFVTNGSLRMRMLPSTSPIFSPATGHLATDGAITLRDVSGTIEQADTTVSLDGPSASILGRVDLDFVGDLDGRLQAHATGQVTSVETAGQVIRMPGHGSQGPAVGLQPFAWFLLPILAAAMFLVSPALHYHHLVRSGSPMGEIPVYSLRTRQAAGLWVWAAWLEARGRLRIASRIATLAVRLNGLMPEARLLRARLMRHFGRHGAALQEYDILALLLSDPEDRASNACDAAELLLAQGSIEEAKARLDALDTEGPFEPTLQRRLTSLRFGVGARLDRAGYQ